MSLVQNIIESGAMVDRLQFGHNLNLIISKVDIEVRRIDGLPTSQNTFITIDQVDPANRKKITASQEVSFFNIDPERAEYAQRNFEEQYACLSGIIKAAIDEDAVLDFEDLYYDDLEGEFGLDVDVNQKFLCDKKGKNSKIVVRFLQEAFLETIKDNLGDRCPLLKANFTANKKGFINPARELTWIVPMEGDFKLTRVGKKALADYEAAVEDRSKSRSNNGKKKKKEEEEFDDVNLDDEEVVEGEGEGTVEGDADADTTDTVTDDSGNSTSVEDDEDEDEEELDAL